MGLRPADESDSPIRLERTCSLGDLGDPGLCRRPLGRRDQHRLSWALLPLLPTLVLPPLSSVLLSAGAGGHSASAGGSTGPRGSTGLRAAGARPGDVPRRAGLPPAVGN